MNLTFFHIGYSYFAERYLCGIAINLTECSPNRLSVLTVQISIPQFDDLTPFLYSC